MFGKRYEPGKKKVEEPVEINQDPQFKRPIILGQTFRPDSTMYATSYFIKRSDVEPILNNYSDYEWISIPLYKFTTGATYSELAFAGTQVDLPGMGCVKRQQVRIEVHCDAERDENYGEMMYGPEVYRLIGGPNAYGDKPMYLCRLTVEHDVCVLGYQGNEYLNIITHTGDQIRVLMLKDSDIKEQGN